MAAGLPSVFGRVALAILHGLPMLPAAAWADEACPDAREVAIEVSTPELAVLACSAAASARAFFEPCGLSVPSGLRLQVVDTIDRPHLACLAEYDCTSNEMRVLSPDALPGAIGEGSAFSMIPTEVLFESLVAHEFTHAVLEAASSPETLSRLSHEYLAYAVQIASLPDVIRADFLASDVGSIDGPSDALINEVILMMAPDLFAGAAYNHFAGTQDICAWVDRVLMGETEFPNAFETGAMP